MFFNGTQDYPCQNGLQHGLQRLGVTRACKDRQGRTLIRLAFYSGMRVSEMLEIGKKNNVLEDGFLLRDTKNGSDQIAPMHDRIRRVRGFLLFLAKHSKIRLQYLVRGAVTAARLPMLHLHDLRHSAAVREDKQRCALAHRRRRAGT